MLTLYILHFLQKLPIFLQTHNANFNGSDPKYGDEMFPGSSPTPHSKDCCSVDPFLNYKYPATGPPHQRIYM
jgi:hypothetical protein